MKVDNGTNLAKHPTEVSVQSADTRPWQGLKRTLSKHWRLVQLGFLGLSLLLIAISLYTNWNALSSFSWELNYPLFVVSLLLVSVMMFTLAVWWTFSIRSMQEQLGWREGTRIWAISQLAKYLPGGVWNYVGRAYATVRAGVSQQHSIVSLVIETILRLLAAIIVFFASLPLWPEADRSQLPLIFLVSALLMGLVALHPVILSWTANTALRVLRRQPVDLTAVKYRHIMRLLVGHVLTVVGAGIAFFLMVASVYPMPAHAALPLAGMLAISVVAGFLNPITPHGLGTREGVLILLLAFYVPMPVAIVIALLSRLWLTLAELIGVLIISLAFRA